MSKFARLVSVIRGILKTQGVTKAEDLNKRRDDFVRDNLRMENNGSGVVVVDGKYDYIPITEKTVPIPQGQLDFIKKQVYDYVGISEPVVQNKATPEEMDAFYTGGLVPFYDQLAQGLTNAIFTEREQAFGHEVQCTQNRLKFATLSARMEAASFLANLGALELDQILDVFDFQPIGGEEGKRRVQSLNMASTKIVDKYQLDSAKQKDGGGDPEPELDPEPTPKPQEEEEQ